MTLGRGHGATALWVTTARRSTSTVKVWNPNVITLGAGTNRSVVYTDTDGTQVALTLSGPGVATLTFEGVVGQTVARTRLTAEGPAELRSVHIADSTAATRLNIRAARGGDALVTIGDVRAPSGLATIGARNVNLAGEVNVGGLLRSATFNTMSGATIAAGSIGSVLAYGAVNDTDVRASDPAGARPTVGRLTFRAPAKELNFDAAGGVGSIAGSSFSDSTFDAMSFRVVTVTGSLVNSELRAFAPLGRDTVLRSLAVGDQMTGSTIKTAGNIGTVAVHAMNGSRIYAGQVDPDISPDGLPEVVEGATIASIAIRPMNRLTPSTFADSVIAAATIRSARLGTVITENADEAFGLVADQIGSLTATNESGGKLSLRRLDDPTTIDAVLLATGFTFNDFVIRVF